MNLRNSLLSALLVAVTGIAIAQTPQPASSAPAGSTGLCKDGTYSDAPSKRGACAGHKGVKDWYATAGGAAATTAAPTPAPAAPAKAAAPKTAAAPATTAAAGGGDGQVWVNSSSKVYHCAGTKYYGKTKAGAYMTEAAAISAGNHADHGKACKAA